MHRAIALAAAGSVVSPRDLAYAALHHAASEGGRDLRSWLAELTETQRLAIIGESVVGVEGFVEAFPVLDASWRPIAEWPVVAATASGTVRVRAGSTCLGRAETRTAEP